MDAGEDRLEVDVLLGVAIRSSERLSIGGHGAILYRGRERKERKTIELISHRESTISIASAGGGLALWQPFTHSAQQDAIFIC